MSRLVVVSNRIGDPTRGLPPGGLVAGLSATMRAHCGLWFGWNEHSATNHGPTIVNCDGITYASISYDTDEYRDFYLGFCTSVLWPLLHGFRDRVDYRGTQYDAYLRMSRRYAHELIGLLEPDDLIWVHDYHLLPLGRDLREAGCTQPIGLFLHTPFPSPQALRVLPGYEGLLAAMLAYDVVGFQTDSDREAFHHAVADTWGRHAIAPLNMHGRRFTTGVFPIGVDTDEIQRTALSRPAANTRPLILGVDRLDYTKGLPQRVRAYDHFLQTCHEHRAHVSYRQIAAPTRTTLAAYADTRRELEDIIADTNACFARADRAAIEYVNHVVPHDAVLGLMRSARVGLVTPLRDGMNLVAKEFVAAQDPADPGVLILSALAGAARELTAALLVDPHDFADTARAIDQALTMPLAERQERHQSMLEVLRRNSIEAWHTRFVAALEEVRGGATLSRPRRS